MKKIISAILTAVMLIASVPVLADWDNDDDIMSLLSELNIMVGDEDGNYRLDDYVTRAEFAKIAVASSSSKNTVASGLKVSPFKDVTYDHWSAAYVKAAVSAGIVSGYLDGTFKPDNNVSYEEAITMMLKVLGYTDDYFGVSYPYGQIGLAENLELTKNVDAVQGEALTRRQVANLVYNALNTKMKDSSSKLITIFDCEVIEGVTIIASHNEDSSLGTDKIYTTAGTYEFDDNFDSDYVGRRGDIVIKNGDDFVSFTPRDQTVEEYTVTNIIGSDIILDGDMYDINSNTTVYYKSSTLTYESAASEASVGDTFKLFKNSNGSVDYCMLISQSSQLTSTDAVEKYIIYSLLSDAVICYDNGSFIQIDITDSTTCYVDTTKSTYGSVKSSMAMGDILYVKMNGSSIDYVSYEEGNMQGPIRVTNSNWLSNFSTNSSTAVMRNGTKVSSSDIQTNDIIYYSEDLNMILAYTDKVTGIYEKASPTKDSPTTITVSGTEYTIESVEAFNALSSSGDIAYGDTVTLLLGRTGEVAGVISGSDTSITATGFVTETGKKDYTNTDGTTYSSYYVKLVTADGTENEYATSSDCSSFKCSVARVTFKDGKASLSKQTGYNSVSGKVSYSKGTIGSKELADDVKILDTVGTYSDDVALYATIYTQRIDGVTISSSSVRYYSTNSAGEIDELILKDVTGDSYDYGVIIKADTTNKSYTIDIDGTQSTYTTSFSSSATGPFKFRIDSSGIDYMVALTQHTNNISELTTTTATIAKEDYLLSDKVVVYEKTGVNSYMKISLNDAINGDYKLTAYYDKAQSSGGRIRVIIAQ
ncbi:MAG: S-layer homology domain-containing protein [Firmicutes bacterium]|nr:S-layer homology domain-containing protein [Bacillota bacterium]